MACIIAWVLSGGVLTINCAGVTLVPSETSHVTSVVRKFGMKVMASTRFILIITTVNRAVASGALNSVEKNVVTLYMAVAW